MPTHGAGLEAILSRVLRPFRGKGQPGIVKSTTSSGLVLSDTGAWVASVGTASPASSVVGETSYGQASSTGSSTDYAREDHTHGTPPLPTLAQLSLEWLTSGVRTERVSASQIRITPSGPDGKARIALFDGSSLKFFTVSANVTADITASGANGLDTGAEAASTFYHLWAIGKSDATFAVLLSTSGSSPTMPSGYTFKRLIGGVPNDGSSNFIPFHHSRNGWVRYKVSGAIGYGGVQVLSGGTATSATAIDLTKAVPDLVGAEFEILSDASNTGATGTRVDYYFSSSNTDSLDHATVAQTANWLIELRNRFTGTVHAARNVILYYAWAAATAGRSVDTWVTAFNIGMVWGL